MTAWVVTITTIQLIWKTLLLLYLGDRSWSWNPFQTVLQFTANAYMYALVIAFRFLWRMPEGVKAIFVSFDTPLKAAFIQIRNIYKWNKVPSSHHPLKPVEETVSPELERILCLHDVAEDLGNSSIFGQIMFSHLLLYLLQFPMETRFFSGPSLFVDVGFPSVYCD